MYICISFRAFRNSITTAANSPAISRLVEQMILMLAEIFKTKPSKNKPSADWSYVVGKYQHIQGLIYNSEVPTRTDLQLLNINKFTVTTW